MDPSVKVDIQLSPNGLHATVANLSAPGQPSLRTITNQAGQPVMPPDNPDSEVAVAQKRRCSTSWPSSRATAP